MNIGMEDPESVFSAYHYEKQLASLKNKSVQKNQNGGTGAKKDEKLYDVCVEFESIFIKQMLNVMRKNIDKSGLLSGGMSEEIFEDMLYDEYALMMAKTSHFGLADMIYRQLNPGEAGLLDPSG